MKKQLIIFALSLITYLAQSQVVPNIDWVKTFNPRFQRANAPSALDANNNVYVTGYISTSASNQDLIVLKYDSLGILLWSYIYNNGGNDAGKAIKVSSTGNVYVTGQSYDAASNFDYYTIKLSPTGSVIWSARYDYSGSTDAAVDIKIDEPAAKVYVTGSGFNGSDNDIITLLYDDSNGSLVWNNVYDGGVSGNDDAVGLVIVDNGNFLMIAGNCINSSGNYDIAAINIKNDGSPNWSYYTDGTAGTNDNAKAIIATGANVAICGMVNNNSSNQDYATIVIDALTPSLIWQNNYDVSNGIQSATSLVNDSTGNIAVTGYAINSGIYEYHTLLYTPAGTQIFTNIESTGINNLYIEPRVATDTIAHHFYVSGAKLNTNNDVFVYQIAPSGNTKWRQYYNGTSNLGDAATGLVVNGIGVVYLSALSLNTSGNWDIVTMKISQTPVYFPIDFNNANEPASTSHLYYSNSGEILIADTTNTIANEVLYYTMYGNDREFVFSNNKIAFVSAKHNSANPNKDSLSRIDLEFHKSNTLSKPYHFVTQDTSSVLNYFLGNLSREIKNVKGNSRIMIPNIYPNIDLHLYSNLHGLKMYFVVKPGADPKLIGLKLNGVTSSTSTSSNQLIGNNSVGTLRFENLQVYSVNLFSMTTTSITSSWNNQGSNIYGINTGSYNITEPLVIQINKGFASSAPPIANNTNWSTYFGSINADRIFKSKCDPSNNLYVAGESLSPTLPLSSVGTFSGNSGFGADAFISKFSSNGELKWSTFVGANGTDQIKDFDFNGSGVYCVGSTTSFTNIPIKTKVGAYNKSNISSFGDAFIFQTNSLGNNNDWFTLYGGDGLDEFRACKFDGAGNFFVVGVSTSTDIPTVGSNPQYIQTYNPIQSVIVNSITAPFNGSYDGIITKFNAGTSAQSWATYLGTHVGNSTYVNDYLNAIDINGSDVYIAGASSGFSLASSSNTKNNSINLEGIVTNFNTNGNLLSTRYSGNEQNNSVKFFGGRVHLCGIASSVMPLLNSTQYFYNTAFGSQDANLSIYSSNIQTLIHSTFIGGSGIDEANDLQFNSNGAFYITGVSQSPSMPPAVAPSGAYSFISNGAKEYFIQAHKQFASNYAWNTFVGTGFDENYASIAIDNSNNIYLCGSTTSYSTYPLNNFGGPPAYFQPVRSGAAPPNSGEDASITRFNLAPINAVIGIRENQSTDNSILVYPNPTNNFLMIDNSKLNSEKFSYTIYNITGQVVLADETPKSNQIINVSNLNTGVYFLNIKSQNGNFISKFIKANN